MEQYYEITEDIAEQLKAVVGDTRFLMGNTMKADYSHDEKSMYGVRAPDAAVEVCSVEEISAVMKICNESKIPVTVRGAGTGLCGGSVPAKGGVLLCTARMNSIIGVDEEEMTITVQPGVTLQEVKDEAESHGLFYPPDPGEKTASIGGNVSTNASGPGAMRYGSTRDYVLAVTAVLPTGEIVKLGCPVAKFSSGLNMLQLIIGSEGTLAVIAEICLKLIPKKKYSISFILPYEQTAEAMAAAGVFRRCGLEATGMEIMTRELMTFAADFTHEPVFPADGEAALLITYESNYEDDLDLLMERFAEIAEETAPMDILVVDNPTLNAKIWEAHAAFQTAVEVVARRFDESDVVLPVGKVAEYIEYVRAVAAEIGVTAQIYGHAGDGSLHIFMYDEASDNDAYSGKAAAFMAQTYSKCTELNGAISGEHGIGQGKKIYLAKAIGEAELALMQNIKKAVDPNGILNPGKVMN